MRDAQGVAGASKDTGAVMVCVTRQKACERLIKAGAKLSREAGDELLVVHVAKTRANFLGSANEAEALEALYQTANDFGADLTVLRSEDVAGTLVQFAQGHRALQIVMGAPPKSGDNALVRELQLRLPDVEFHVLES